MDEPEISINGHQLSKAQAMTIRVACESFISDLVENGLGDDEHGKIMTENYLMNLQQIRSLIFINFTKEQDEIK